MSLHHVALEPVCAALARLLRPHGLLLVSEFAWDAYDERAAGWLDRHDDSGKDNSVGAWQREHAGLHTGDTVRAGLAEVFEIEPPKTTPYLSRMLGRPSSKPTRRRSSRAGSCRPSASGCTVACVDAGRYPTRESVTAIIPSARSSVSFRPSTRYRKAV